MLLLSFYTLLQGVPLALAASWHSGGELMLTGDLLFGGALLMACSAYALRHVRRRGHR